MHKMTLMGLAALATLALPTAAQAQVVGPIVVGALGPGVDVTQPMNFATGGEIFVFAGSLTTNIAAGTGRGMVIDTIGGTMDVELAFYGAGAMGLIAYNDDGPSSIANGDPGLDSVIVAGDAWAMYNQDGYDGPVNGGCLSSPDLPSGAFVLVYAQYSTTWDCVDARNSVADTTPTAGMGSIHGMIM